MFRKIAFLVIYHMGNFDDFRRSGFCVTPKISLANSCKLIQKTIITLVSFDPLNLENAEKK